MNGANTGNSPNLRAPWKKGESGNPSGRPRGDGWFRKLCRKRTVRALKALERAMDGADAGPAVSAAKALLEFGWGKAPAVVTLEDEAGTSSVTVTPKAALAALLSDKPRGPDDSEN